MDPNLPVSEFTTLQDLVDRAVSPRRFLVLLLAGFAGFALLLASLGIYAVISYSVNQRVQEIGIRMALGASAIDLQNRILLQTLGLAALGLALGMVASRVLTRALGSLLFGVTPGDPGHICRNGRPADGGGGRRRLLPRASSFAHRSHGGLARELACAESFRRYSARRILC